MNNPALAMMRARGMAGIFDDISGEIGGGVYSGGTTPTGGHSTLNTIVSSLSTFGNNFLSAWQNRGVAQAGINPFGGGQTVAAVAPQGQVPYGTAPGSQVSAGIGGFIQSAADSLGVSTTTLAIGAAVGLFLLFKPPPSRR